MNARAGLRGVGGANGPEDGLDDRFVAQSKAYAPGRYPGWMAAELDKLVSAGDAGSELARFVRAASRGRLPVLFVSESPGSGRRPRDVLAIMRLDDWLVAVAKEGV